MSWAPSSCHTRKERLAHEDIKELNSHYNRTIIVTAKRTEPGRVLKCNAKGLERGAISILLLCI